MKLLLLLKKEVVKLKKGLNYSLRVLFDTFLTGILFSVLSELVFLAIAKLLNFDIYLDTDVFMSVLVAIFLTFIFSGKNIINQLFINGCSRKKIANIKTLCCTIYSLAFFLLIFLFEIFYAKLFSTYFISSIFYFYFTLHRLYVNII